MMKNASYRNFFTVKVQCAFVSALPIFIGVLATYAAAQSPAPTKPPPAAEPAPGEEAAPSIEPTPTSFEPETPPPAPPARPVPKTQQRPKSVASAPPLVAEPASLDFGFLPPNTPGEGTILLRNTGDKPLTINLIQPTCKCTTTTDLVGKQIAPGGSAELQIKLDGAPAMGVRRSSVKVMVDGYGPALEVTVKGEVSLPVRVVPPYINAVEQKNLTGRIILESLDRKPFRILSSFGAPISIQGFDGAVDEPRSSYLVGYDLTSLVGTMPTFIFFETDAPGAGVVDVRVRQDKAPKKPLIAVMDTRCNVGLIPAKTSKDALFTLMNSAIVVESVSTTSTDATVSLARTEPAKGGGVNAFVTVTPREGFTGILRLPVIFKTATQSAEFEVIASVRP